MIKTAFNNRSKFLLPALTASKATGFKLTQDLGQCLSRKIFRKFPEKFPLLQKPVFAKKEILQLAKKVPEFPLVVD